MKLVSGTDTVFFYLDQGAAADVFDFSAFIDFTDGSKADNDELADFITFIEDSDGSLGSTAGSTIEDSLGQVWFEVNETLPGQPFNFAEQVFVLVDGQDFVWNVATDEWDFA